jgi:hypothetical protein
MKTQMLRFACALGLVGLMTGSAAAIGYGDTQPRAMGMAGSYTSMARGVESLYWNPANLALADSPKYSLPLNLGFTYMLENNSWSISDYNDFNGDFIDEDMKDDLLADIDRDGLQFNTDVGLFLPLIGGAAFPMPWGLQSAMAVNVRFGVEGQVPGDMIEFLLRGNQFERERLAQGRDPNYDIAEWDGQAWALGVFSWGFAKPWMPAAVEPYVSQFTVGTTLKVIGGGMGEVIESDGGFVTRVSGTQMEASGVARSGGGVGFGIDLGVAGVSKDGRTTGSLSLVNLLDVMNWSIDAQQDSVFVIANGLNALSFTGADGLEEIFDNPREVVVNGVVDTLFRADVDSATWAEGDPVFRKDQDVDSFGNSLPAMLRFGVSHTPFPRLTVALNYDQAFSSGFGISSTPRVSLGGEYRLVDWFPLRMGLSAGGRAGSSSALGFAFGPFTVKRFRLVLLETAVVNRGGILPGVSQGFGYSINLLKMRIKR